VLLLIKFVVNILDVKNRIWT